MQWFENELPLQDPHTLKDKDYVAMAEISAFQQEVEFFGMDWYMIQPAMQLKSLTQNMNGFILMTL